MMHRWSLILVLAFGLGLLNFTQCVQNTTETATFKFDPAPNDGKYTIGLLIPSTTNICTSACPAGGREKHRQQMDNLDVMALPLVKVFFPTFKESMPDWHSNRYFKFILYLGYDEGDAVYDDEDRLHQLLLWIRNQMLTYEGFDIKTHRFGKETKHHPAKLWSALAKYAYDDGVDYMYQLNDDLSFETPFWAARFVGILQKSPFYPNVGVTGPFDLRWKVILTQTFVHRTHIDIFGDYFPPVFANIYSDNWLHGAYGPYSARNHSPFRPKDIIVTNTNIDGTRYKSTDSKTSRDWLKEEFKNGCVKLASYFHPPNLPTFNYAECEKHAW